MQDKVIAANGMASRRAIAIHRQLILPVAVLLLISAGVLAALMQFNAGKLDQEAEDDSRKVVEEALDVRAHQLDRVVKDYAWWNEAVVSIELQRDLSWAEDRLGAVLFSTHAYDLAFVVAPDDSTFYASHNGVRTDVDIASALGNEFWRPVVAQARVRIAEVEPEAVHAYVPMRGARLGIMSASAIVPEATWDGRRLSGTPYVLVVVRSLTTAWLEELARALGVDRIDFEVAPALQPAMPHGAKIEPQPVRPRSWLAVRLPGFGDGVSFATDPTAREPTRLELAGPATPAASESLPVGIVSWQSRRPGTDYVVALAPSLCVALLLLAALGWSALRQSRSSTLAIVESESRFRDVADASSDWIFETDAAGGVTWISDRFIALTGIALGDIEGRPITELLLPMAGEDRSGDLDQALREEQLFRGIPRCYLDLEGRPRALRVSGKPTRDANGRLVGWRGTATDVTVEIEARKTAEFLSGHDALTGALNRQGLIEGTVRLLDAARRRGQLAAFLLIDVDRFKEVNDVHGPIVGDRLIRAVAQRLTNLAQPGDVVARLGADEFVLVRPAVADAQAVQPLAKALQEALAQPMQVADQELAVSVSVAAIMLPSEADTAERALHMAGMVMTRAKEDGRSALRFFEPGMDARLQARKALERDMAKAIENHEFEVFYQPKMNARTRELSGVEALIRWRHPQHGLIAPGLFIPVAEETRMIAQIGRWVLERACQDAAEWGDVQVAVNLSPAQFIDDDLLDTVANALRHSGLPPAQLEVEITEGVLLANNARSNAMMNQFVDMGVHLAMDDFGTGYSSMSYLTKFRFNKIKIDRSFVQALDRGGEAIILAIVGMTRSLGIKSCAEGIETEEQMAALRVMGIDEVQGYLFGRPMPRAELVERFRPGRRPARKMHAAA
jgi:diguanylate cyclase (GGDEF)-like protein/PAS domain S-box-containing protein